MVHIYWGLGKGKTSLLNGSAIRAKGAGLSVGIFRFLKGMENIRNEDKLLQKCKIKVLPGQTQSKFFVQMTPEEREAAAFQNTTLLLKALESNYDVIILDEFLDLAANNVGILSEDDILNALDTFKGEVLISGHTKLKKVFDFADLVTHYQPEKHYFDRGIEARSGIEY